MKEVSVVILCAGNSSRFGVDKLEIGIGGKPVWKHSVDTFLGHPDVTEVVLVTSHDKVSQYADPQRYLTVAGGTSRQESSQIGILATRASAEFVLIHDGARPLVSADLISRAIAALSEADAVVPALPVTDTIKQRLDGKLVTLDRSQLVAVQTPQGARRRDLVQAHHSADLDATDDMALIEKIGILPMIIDGERRNIKITTPEDLAMAIAELSGSELRTGMGYDIHSFSSDPTRPMWLGSVLFEDCIGLEGHSDADVLLHAITDALLGAASLGDIGQLFPNTDPQWKNCASKVFLSEAGRQLKHLGWSIVNIDATVVAEMPKIGPKQAAIRQAIAETLGLQMDQISIKATTNERLGALGRSEGIAATAIATIRRGG